jgi:hypothetical protein
MMQSKALGDWKAFEVREEIHPPARKVTDLDGMSGSPLF